MVIDQVTGDLFQWLRGFYLVAEAGSVTKAGQIMGREQSTVTRQIRCLEREYGITLFHRSPGGMKLTPEGQALFEKTISVFELLREIKSNFHEVQVEYEGTIVIAASPTTAEAFLPPCIEKFLAANPRLRFHVDSVTSETAVERVATAAADFGIAAVESVPDSIGQYELFEHGMKLVVPKCKPFITVPSPTLADVAELPLILFSRSSSVEQLVVDAFTAQGLKPKVVLTHNMVAALKRCVQQGIGVALIGGNSLSDEDLKIFDVFPMDQYFPTRRYAILLRKKKYSTPAVRAFLRSIKPDINFDV